MPKFELIPFEHIDELSISGELIFFEGEIQVTYLLSDLEEKINFEYELNNQRVIGLWENTCFEFFILSPAGDYYEFNFATNLNWNIFHFKNYRSKLKEAKDCPVPLIDVRENKLHFTYNLNSLPKDFYKMGKMKVGITAVLKDKNSKLTYWSLAHPKDKADFHSQVGMTISL